MFAYATLSCIIDFFIRQVKEVIYMESGKGIEEIKTALSN